MSSEEQMELLANSVDMLSRTLSQPERKELSSEETQQAKQVLLKENLLFPRSVKSIHDPVILGQEYCLFSFTPAQDAKPNPNGIYGVFKVRGSFSNLEESQEYAEKLIRNHDSYNEIHTIRVGQCIPLTKKVELVEETQLIDLNNQIENIVSKDVKEKRQQEKIEMKTIQEREQKLLQENKEILNDEYKQDPLDQYIMLRVKKAQLMWTLSENRKRIREEVIPAIKKAKEEIAQMNLEYPDFDKSYYQRYIDARESVGIQDKDKLNYSYFMKYLLDDNDEPLD
jgi:hypothetical protein